MATYYYIGNSTSGSTHTPADWSLTEGGTPLTSDVPWASGDTMVVNSSPLIAVMTGGEQNLCKQEVILML